MTLPPAAPHRRKGSPLQGRPEGNAWVTARQPAQHTPFWSHACYLHKHATRGSSAVLRTAAVTGLAA